MTLSHCKQIRGTRQAGVSLVECLLALLLLSWGAVGVGAVVSSSHQHLASSDAIAMATGLADDLLEEIISRPYGSAGSTRATFGIDDFDGFAEASGGLADAWGQPYDELEQCFGRRVTVTPASMTLDDLAGHVVVGRAVTVSVTLGDRPPLELSRFVVDPEVDP